MSTESPDVARALQAYADSTKGPRKPTAEYRKWRRRSIVGGIALTAMMLAGFRSCVGGNEASLSNGTPMSDAASPNVSVAPSTEAPLDCSIENTGALTEAQGIFGLPVTLKVNKGVVTTLAVPYSKGKVVDERFGWGSNNETTPKFTANADGLVTGQVNLPSGVIDVAVYAQALGEQYRACGAFMLDQGVRGGVQFVSDSEVPVNLPGQ